MSQVVYLHVFNKSDESNNIIYKALLSYKNMYNVKELDGILLEITILISANKNYKK